MSRSRPARLRHIAGIGVDRMGSIADASGKDFLRLENLDTDIPPDPAAIARTVRAAGEDADNSYLPFIGQPRLREVAARHVSAVSGVSYSGERNCVISAGGLSGILNVLLATIEVGDEVVVTDPTYAGLINRVRLAGGVPRFVPFVFEPGGEWRLDRQALRASIGPKTTAMLLMSPSMPSGGCLDAGDWALVAELCVAHDLLLIVDTAMERLLFDGRPVLHPAGLPGMAERTITVGSSAKELRMIGWRVGWIVAPEAFMPDLVAVSLANVVVPVGIGQDAVATALENSAATLTPYVDELQARRDCILAELRGLPVGIPGGGWSLLLRVSDFGLDGAAMSERLLEQGVCATAMTGWGESHGAQYVRFVYANEPVERLRGLGTRVRAALGL
ncbi:pyridoxal phosphate-dependent aminotransferase [Bosea sp. CS1GBMeth4]|uniref:pyridoxal phosphate-dependent aminotransferase n=1 Tax=Bosea sp. CS1GBMeth4 TaxID=1892849 RepID=UPI00164751ED|nr:pyridoxal phosphate-dependent aminotransferase [Bosea sp. CS1GBMeth4]